MARKNNKSERTDSFYCIARVRNKLKNDGLLFSKSEPQVNKDVLLCGKAKRMGASMARENNKAKRIAPVWQG